MKTTLTEFIRKHYDMGYLGDYRDKNRKRYLEFDKRNEKELTEIVSHYKNIKIVKKQYRYAPELISIFVTLA